MHLLDLGFLEALNARANASVEAVGTIATKQLVGIAGVAAERISRALGTSALETLALHPLLNPAAYVAASFADDTVTVASGPAHEDGGWISLCGPGSVRPLQAAVREVDPHLDVEVTSRPPTSTRWRSRGSAPVSGSGSNRAGRCRSRHSEGLDGGPDRQRPRPAHAAAGHPAGPTPGTDAVAGSSSSKKSWGRNPNMAATRLDGMVRTRVLYERTLPL
jgi:hypothetical protein